MADALLDEILEEIDLTEPECARCGRPMVTKYHWKVAGRDEKWELWRDGYEAYGGGKGADAQCSPCLWQTGPLRDDELAIRDARRYRVFEYKALLDEGVTDINEQARRLGITRAGLVRNIKTWKKRGWL